MCNPALAVMAVSTAVSVYSTQQSQKAQQKMANDQASADMKNAKNAQIVDTNALKEKSEQIASQAQDVKLQRQKMAMRERSKMRVTSAGASGNSIDRLFNTSYFNEQEDINSIEHNKDNNQVQNLHDLEKVNSTATGRYRNAKASWMSGKGNNSRLLLSGIQGGLQGYAMGKTMFK